MKHGLSADHANRRCAVVKDLIKGTTKWRGKAKEEAEEIVGEAVELLHVATEELGQPLVERLVEEDDTIFAEARQLLEVASWMIPAAAKRKGFKPLDPEKKKGSKDTDFEKKHPRGKGAEGGQFVRKGASNQATAGVQRKLGGKVDGVFGQATKKLVERFQRKHGLVVDGVVGAQTAAALLGKGKQKPGAMPTSARKALKRLGSGGLKEGELEERTVHVETLEDEPGVKRATISKIRSALYDLSEPRNPTHTVQLPKGTKVTVKPGMPTRTYSSYSRTFVITSADGETTKEAVGADEAAEVAKEVDGGAVRTASPAAS
ncbi:MAG TPA: peptidoglycan-binding domain-containing protein, partial [Solirubrobacterales bacterium]|nr:peptidoglycan-binding domain-containing protein [Solirubrobacterales bacterium]